MSVDTTLPAGPYAAHTDEELTAARKAAEWALRDAASSHDRAAADTCRAVLRAIERETVRRVWHGYAWAVGDPAVFADPEMGPRHGYISAIYGSGAVEMAVGVAGDSRSICYTVNPGNRRLTPA